MSEDESTDQSENWCVSRSKTKGMWNARIPLPPPQTGRVYVGASLSKHEAERKRDKGFLKYWGRIPSKEEVDKIIAERQFRGLRAANEARKKPTSSSSDAPSPEHPQSHSPS